MLNPGEVTLEQLAIHYVGNPLQDELLMLSDDPVVLKDDTVLHLLQQYFFKPFKGDSYYHLMHEAEISLNEVFSAAHAIFNNPDALFEQSRKLAKLLYDKTDHPNIKGGEFYVAYLSNCQTEGEITDAIGLFKSETRETYLKVYPDGTRYGIEQREGININKLDKGCLIFNIEAEKGYKVAMVDTVSRGEEAAYWKDNFLHVKAREDSFYHTQNYMHLTKDFVKDVFNEEHGVDRSEQIVMMNRSAGYFNEQKDFDRNHFESEVMQEPEVIEAFNDYREKYQRDKNMPLYDEFAISPAAVKGNKKIFKSILKLDKNFHVYIHGNRDYIRRGFDEESGMHFYQLFFRNES